MVSGFYMHLLLIYSPPLPTHNLLLFSRFPELNRFYHNTRILHQRATMKNKNKKNHRRKSKQQKQQLAIEQRKKNNKKLASTSFKHQSSYKLSNAWF